ncbi:MAG: pectate lyase [Mediterranea sp.]|jgi:PelA/Pel-15E family pectate lyase|nr:pectate lyase [Mediterranea sp.]
MGKKFILLLLCAAGCLPVTAQQPGRPLLSLTDTAFFNTAEARRIGEQLLAYQRNTGGWSKNIDMARPLNGKELKEVLKDKSRSDDSTIDNGATTQQMNFLARLYHQTGDTRYRDAFRRAVLYLLSGQYDNGGWPQFWPNARGYQVHITFNDDAMVNTLNLLRSLAEAQPPYEGDLIGEALRKQTSEAFDKGIECILATQIIVDGQPTVWCQQHDRITLKPAAARAYELPSFCSQESAAIVQLLMTLPCPDDRTKRAVEGAMKWLDAHKIVTPDAQAAPIWARFYDLEEEKPFFCDRDGIPRRRLEEIGDERRYGYSWYNNRAASLYPQYDEWAQRHIGILAH